MLYGHFCLYSAFEHDVLFWQVVQHFFVQLIEFIRKPKRMSALQKPMCSLSDKERQFLE